jgi:large subunit ribosomal protein L4
LALQTALYLSNKKIRIIEEFTNSVETFSTKNVVAKLKPFINQENNLLIVKNPTQKFVLSIRNIANIKVLYSNALNVKDILHATNILITEDALENIQTVYHD